MTRVTIMVAGVLCAGSAWAQGVYVAGAIGAEVVRTASTRSGGNTYDIGSGEALAGAIRIGTGISRSFGVELEFFRPGEIEVNLGGPFYLTQLSFEVMPGGVVGSGIGDSIFPSLIGQTSRVRATTTSALAFARQSLGSRMEIAYLGGVGFSRVVRETEFGFPRGVLPLAPSIPRSLSTRTTQYAAGPVVGIDVRAGMTEHAQVVAGLRMHALGQSVVDGWMIRPSIGLAWRF